MARKLSFAWFAVASCSVSIFGLACSSAEFQTSAEDAPGDTLLATDGCVKNACGGCASLPAKPGDACGDCGKYVCDTTGEAVQCQDPGRNTCGGCGTLTGSSGDKCGACGKLGCSSDGSTLDCKDPGFNACGGCHILPGKVGDPCGGGSCGTGTLKCTSTDSMTCLGATGANDCGGCGKLDGAPYSSCGACGQYLCSVDKSSVACAEATPAFGSSCGICGTSKYACTGLATTGCTTPDDRTLGNDIDFAKKEVVTASVDRYRGHAIAYTTRHQGRVQKLAVTLSREAYTCPVRGGIVPIDGGTLDGGFLDGGLVDAIPEMDAPIEAGGFDGSPGFDAGGLCGSPDPGCSCTTASGTCVCSGPTTTGGTVTVTLYQGTPGGTAAYVGSTTMPPTLVPLGTATSMVFVFPTSMPSIPKGTPVYYEFATTDSQWRLNFWGIAGVAGSDPDLAQYTRINLPTLGSWSVDKGVPQTTVGTFGCF